MAVDPALVMAAYTVAGVGVTSDEVYADLQAALDAADVINRATAGTTSSGYGRAFVVPAMAIKYPAPIPSTTPPSSSSGSGGGLGVDLGIHL